MYTKTYQNKNLDKDFRGYSKSQNDCQVIKVSTEIMLYSFTMVKKQTFLFKIIKKYQSAKNHQELNKAEHLFDYL